MVEQATESPKTDGAVHCHFWDPETKQGKNVASRCTGDATGFVRVKHSGRLCPLCDPCKKTFIQAQSQMTDEVKKAIPGAGEFEEVGLDAGREEFAKQPPKS